MIPLVAAMYLISISRVLDISMTRKLWFYASPIYTVTYQRGGVFSEPAHEGEQLRFDYLGIVNKIIIKDRQLMLSKNRARLHKGW